MENPKRLYRSNTNKVFAGVAGGIAEYFDIDPIIVRLLFVIITIAGGSGVLIYIILWIALPPAPIKPFTFNMDAGSEPGTEAPQESNVFNESTFSNSPAKRTDGALIGGLVLITIGALFLAHRLIPTIHFGDLWPILLVVIGGVLIYTSFHDREKKNDNTL